MKEFINKTTLIDELIKTYPASVPVLLNAGMHCLGCPASRMESLEEACMVHGLDPDGVVKQVNEAIAAAATA